MLNHNVSVLMGANVANEVAQGQFCEATLGTTTTGDDQVVLTKLFNCAMFRVRAVDDIAGVELLGGRKRACFKNTSVSKWFLDLFYKQW